MKMSLPKKKNFFFRETPTSPWVPFRAKFQPLGIRVGIKLGFYHKAQTCGFYGFYEGGFLGFYGFYVGFIYLKVYH